MNNTTKIVLAVIVIIIIVGGIFAYIHFSSTSSTNPSPTPTPASTATPSPTAQPTVMLTGAGATFPYPLLNAMIINYTQAKPNVQINYQSIGSGGGISALEGKTVNFAASDAPLGASDMAKAPNTLHIPETIGAVTIAYNLPGISKRSSPNWQSYCRHLFGQRYEVERPRNTKPKPKYDSPGTRHSHNS